MTTKTFLNNESNNASVAEYRKGSLESLGSQQSCESQLSVESSESHESVKSQHHPPQSQQHQIQQPIPSTRVRRISAIEHQHTLSSGSRPSSLSRHTDSSSTACSDGEIDLETPTTVHSAPPVFTGASSGFSSPRSIKNHQEIWKKKSESEYIPHKPTITRSPNVSQQHRHLSENMLEQERLNRLERLHKSVGKIENPLRRRMSEDEVKDYANYLRKQSSESDAKVGVNVTNILVKPSPNIIQKEKGEPDVPVCFQFFCSLHH